MNKHQIMLERFTEKDFGRLISWTENEKELIQFAGTVFQFPLTEEQLFNYLSDSQKHIFKIVDYETSQAIGHCEVYEVDGQTCRLCRILIGAKDYRGKGYGTALVEILTKWSFETLGVNCVELNVYDFNLPAIKCYEKIGFKKIKVNEESTKVGDENWTSFRMAIDLDTFISLPS